MSGGATTEALVEEFIDALRRGESPEADAFAAAHRDHADELRDLLPLIAEMEDYGRDIRSTSQGSAPYADPPDLSGSDFTLLKVIGRGGMGTVWEAMQTSLHRKVAVKVLRPPSDDANAWRERFSQESRIVAQLHHPNIVKVYGAGTSGDICYYAMELIDGTRLDRFKFQDLRATVRTVLQAAQALAYAHRCGIIHRDVKPANLMIDAAGELRVTDFGLATARASAEAAHDAQNGTLRYMAPERLSEGVCLPASDQYALGVTLWELIARRPLFGGRSGSAIAQCIRKGAIPPLEGVDGDLVAIVAKSTRLDPTDRYRDMEAFADDMRSWLDHRCVSAVRATPMHRLRLWARRRPATAALSAAAALCAVAFAAALAAGFVRTSAALRLAARNAAVADAALGDIFRYVERTATSRRGAELLSALLPYYERLAGDSGLPPEKVAEVNGVLGVCAFRSGDYALAEQAFRRVIARKPSAAALNRLAETLRRLKRDDEALALSQHVASGYASSTNMEERYEAALALETLGRQNHRHSDRRRAFEIAGGLRAASPENPDFRFLYARLLAEYPGLSNFSAHTNANENAYLLLSHLSADYPDRSEYSRALVAAMDRRLRKEKNPQSIDRADVELALDTADRLIGRYPNVPDVVSAVIAFRNSYSSYLQRLGDRKQASRERIRTSGMLELLSHSAEW